MASGTKIRPFSRLLDTTDVPLWIIGPSGRLTYLTSGCAAWLKVDVELLVDRRSIAGTPVSDDPLDLLAASLSPPHGIASRGTASLKIHPPSMGDARPSAREVRFIRVGQGDASWTICVAGDFDDRVTDTELQDAVALRQRLDVWRHSHGQFAVTTTVGDSTATRQLRQRLKVAASTRTDVGFFGPIGCNSQSMATRVHQLSAPGEPLIVVDGPLMDPELLDASLIPLVHQLNDSARARGSVLVRDLTEMPLDAQLHLASMITTFAGRLRLLALCRPSPEQFNDASDDQELRTGFEIEMDRASGLCSDLIDVLSSLHVVIEPIARRVDDIPMLATALLDSVCAAGKSTAERLSRAAMDALVVYPWPRDHEELREAIDHAARTATKTIIGVENLPLAIRSYRPGHTTSQDSVPPLDDAVKRFEWRLIHQAIEQAGGNRAEAARRLGISRARLLRKLEDQTSANQAEEE